MHRKPRLPARQDERPDNPVRALQMRTAHLRQAQRLRALRTSNRRKRGTVRSVLGPRDAGAPQVQLPPGDRQERGLRAQAAADPQLVVPRHLVNRGAGHVGGFERAARLQRHLPLGDHGMPSEDPDDASAQHQGGAETTELLSALRVDVEEGIHREGCRWRERTGA